MRRPDLYGDAAPSLTEVDVAGRTQASAGRWSRSGAMALVAACVASGCSFRVASLPPGEIVPTDASVVTRDFGTIAPTVDLAMTMPVGPDMTVVAPPVDMASNAHITVTSTGTVGPIDLTALGTSDWVHWGYAKVDDVDRKATGNSQITALMVTGSGGLLKQFTPFPTHYTWSDGSSDNGGHMSTPSNAGGVYTNAGGLRITVPAGRASRQLTVHVSYVNAQARMQMALSDNSTPGHDDSGNNTNDGMLHDVAYTVDYAAANDGQQLTITWSLAVANNGMSALPAVAMCAAVLGPAMTTSFMPTP
jgi:hypothetical protein